MVLPLVGTACEAESAVVVATDGLQVV